MNSSGKRSELNSSKNSYLSITLIFFAKASNSYRLGLQWRVIYRVIPEKLLFQVASITAHDYRSLVSSEDVFLLRVQGHSMIDAHIQDGDFALVKPQPNAENGEIVVALIEDEATIKRIFKKRDLIRLEPANPRIEPIVVKKGEKRITIVGKVVGIFREL